MIYELLGQIVKEVERFYGHESQREKIMSLNREFSEAFFSGKERNQLSEKLQMEYNSCINIALASIMDESKHNELVLKAQELYRQLPKPE